jgi:hypothetical protein
MKVCSFLKKHYKGSINIKSTELKYIYQKSFNFIPKKKHLKNCHKIYLTYWFLLKKLFKIRIIDCVYKLNGLY